MLYQIKRDFLCPHCSQVAPVVFDHTASVTLRNIAAPCEKGVLVERQFLLPTRCSGCGQAFSAFIRVHFYHKDEHVTPYDSGEILYREVGVMCPLRD